MVDKEKPEKSEDEWSNLRSEVDDAINKRDASSIDFSNKTIYQCRYQQKYADVKKSEYSPLLSVLIFALAMGLTLISRLKENDLILGSILISIGLILFFSKYIPENKTYMKIIINAEKRIQELSKEEHIKDKGKPNVEGY